MVAAGSFDNLEDYCRKLKEVDHRLKALELSRNGKKESYKGYHKPYKVSPDEMDWEPTKVAAGRSDWVPPGGMEEESSRRTMFPLR